jgi:hypothetical protein
MVASGDQDAALEQVRTALSLAARARLLHAGVLPGARDELPQQLADLDLPDVSEALASTIHSDTILLADLALAVDLSDALVSTPSDAVSIAWNLSAGATPCGRRFERASRGCSRYRYGDSNPGFRRERAAS